MTNKWPLQTPAEMNKFFGNPQSSPGQPSATWESKNLVLVTPPFTVRYAGKPVKGLRVHRLVAESLRRVLDEIWEASGRSQRQIDSWGMSTYSGGYVFRLKRGGNSLSMHSWGTAVDFDPERNAMGDTTPNFANIPQVLAAFAREGWEWGGLWSGKSCDGMHFQAARTSSTPLRIPSATAVASKPSKAPSVAPAPIQPPQKGASSIDGPSRDDVVAVQTLLRDKGWNPGKIDGDLGVNTMGEIVKFRLSQKPQLLPITPTIDAELLEALRSSSPRPVSSARAGTTVSDLKKEGDDTTIKADSNVKAAAGFTIFSGAGLVDQLGGIDMLRGVVDNVGVAQDVGDKLLSLGQWFLQKWWIAAICFALYMGARAWSIRQQRLQEYRTGRNMSI